MMNKWLMFVAALALFAIAFPAFLPQPLDRDAPRDLPWVLPDYRLAKVHWEVGERGRIHNHVEHLFLPDISPKMVAWFYQQLPISTVEYSGNTLPLYHIFHPTEHGRISVLETASDGVPGMGVGAMIMREEWFGPFDSRGRARLQEFGEDGMLAIPEIAGFTVGEVRHRWWAEQGGTRYTVDARIGVDWPVLGRLVNWGVRRFVFHPKMMAKWQRHQVQEVSSLRFFLLSLYSQRGGNNHYSLDAAVLRNK